MGTKAQAQTMQGMPQPSPIILRLADALDSQLELPSAGFPNIGSKGHMEGTCKPCAFYWRQDGCQNGCHCNFCHVCEPGERRRRKKEKKHLGLNAIALFPQKLQGLQVGRPTSLQLSCIPCNDVACIR